MKTTASRRAFRLLVAGASAVALRAAAAGRGDMTSIPDDWLRDRTLVLRGGEAIVVAPPGSWRWYGMGHGGGYSAFLCANRMDEMSQLVLAVSDGFATKLTTREVEATIRDVKRLTKGSGASIARPSYESSDLPFPGSYRIRYEAVTAGATLYGFAYMGLRGRLYLTMAYSLSPDEPPALARFTASIVAREVVLASRGGLLVYTLLVLGGVVAWWRKIRAS